MNNKEKIFILFFALFIFILPFVAFGRVGVGIGTGSITMDEKLKLGGIYSLPDLPVINTGDETFEYEISIEYLSDASEKRPSREWFTFSPNKFTLEPSQSKAVNISLTIPTKAEPGDYFAYIEARPIKKVESGQTSIGIAAAAKLNFTIAPANIFQALYYRGASLYNKFYPWDAILLGFIFFIILIFVLKSKFNIQVSTKNTKRKRR
jgi:hypothetical protein